MARTMPEALTKRVSGRMPDDAPAVSRGLASRIRGRKVVISLVEGDTVRLEATEGLPVLPRGLLIRWLSYSWRVESPEGESPLVLEAWGRSHMESEKMTYVPTGGEE